MKNRPYLKYLALALLMAGIVFNAGKLFADHDHDDEGRENRNGSNYPTERGVHEIPMVTNPKWKAECTSCHMAYLPGLLPERSWRKLMNGLDQHFGENASLDDATKKEITDFLVQNSSDHTQTRRGKKILKTISSTEAPIRISETPYFMRKHDEISASIFKRKSVGSAANCIACHRGAERGDFSEEQVVIPRDVFKKSSSNSSSGTPQK